MKRILACFLGGFRWYRRWHGGKWAYVFVDVPVGSHMWLTLPPDAGPDYLEPLWGGVFEVEDWTTTTPADGG